MSSNENKTRFTTLRNKQGEVIGFYHKSVGKFIEILKNFDESYTAMVGHVNDDGTHHAFHTIKNNDRGYCKRWGARIMSFGNTQ